MMVRFVARRLLGGILQLFLVTLVAFILFFVVSAATGAGPAVRMAGKSATAAQIRLIDHQLGTDQPLYLQYASFLGRLLHGDFGQSYMANRAVTDLVLPAAGATASLVAVAVVIWMAIAVPTGLLGGTRPGSVTDRLLMTLCLVGLSVPTFWLAPMASYYLAFKPTQGQLFGIDLGGPHDFLPIGGYVRLTDDPVGWLYHLLLPALVLAISFAAIYARFIRAMTVNELAADYVRTARAKGAGERRVLARHVGRNVAPTVVTLLGLDVGAALAGVVFVERVFNIPGLGNLAVTSILDTDYPLAIGVIVFAAFAAVAANTVVDVVHAMLDPRARTA
jgi:peptide/nickel transport system permease protein